MQVLCSVCTASILVDGGLLPADRCTSGDMPMAPMVPIPPALETAAQSSAPVTCPMPAAHADFHISSTLDRRFNLRRGACCEQRVGDSGYGC